MSANWSGRTLVPGDAGGLRERRLRLDQLELGRDEIERRVVALHDHRGVLDHLRRMNGRRDRRRRVDQPELAKDALFEIGEAGALAGAPAAAGHRDAADDAEVELRHVLEADRLAVLQEALRGRRGLEIDALGGELVGVDTQIGKALGEIGHGREQELAVVERAEPHRDLRRIGIALDDARAFPGVELAQPLRGDVGADEIRDAVEGRADVDPGLDERAQMRLRTAVLGAVAPRPARISCASGMISAVSQTRRPARERRPRARARAPTRSARSSRHGAAMICTPIGSLSPSVQTGRATDRQADERDRLGEEADIGPHQHFPAVEDEGLLAELQRAAGRRRRDQDVDVAEERQRPRQEPPPELLRLRAPRRRAASRRRSSRSRTSGSKSAARVWRRSKMERRAFDHGDEIGRRPRPLGLFEFDDPIRLQRPAIASTAAKADGSPKRAK